MRIPLATVDDAQDGLIDLEATLQQPVEQRRADGRVLRRALVQAQRDLVSVDGDPERDDDRVVAHADPINHQPHQGHVVQRARERGPHPVVHPSDQLPADGPFRVPAAYRL